jgi:hypothetical protein
MSLAVSAPHPTVACIPVAGNDREMITYTTGRIFSNMLCV